MLLRNFSIWSNFSIRSTWQTMWFFHNVLCKKVVILKPNNELFGRSFWVQFVDTSFVNSRNLDFLISTYKLQSDTFWNRLYFWNIPPRFWSNFQIKIHLFLFSFHFSEILTRFKNDSFMSCNNHDDLFHFFHQLLFYILSLKIL